MWCRGVKPLVLLLDVAGLGGIQIQAAGSAALAVSLRPSAWALEFSAQVSPLCGLLDQTQGLLHMAEWAVPTQRGSAEGQSEDGNSPCTLVVEPCALGGDWRGGTPHSDQRKVLCVCSLQSCRSPKYKINRS